MILISLLLPPLLPLCAVAEEQDGMLSDGVRSSVERALEKATRDGLSLRERINILKDSHDLPDSVRETARNAGLNALNNAGVRGLLGVGDLDASTSDAGEERYPQGLFVFASFSMPAPSLRQLLMDASDQGVPVVFNGFVNNSAFETEAVLRRLFADAINSHGFMIDPTLFTRFGITAVPSFVATNVDLDVCDTPGCAGDAVPVHDVVKGNISLASALRIIAKGGGDAPEPAIRALGDRL